VIPYAPGGANDALARPWAEKMRSMLATIIIDNIGGAGGALGVSAAARARPDGYTILLGNVGNQVIAPMAATRPLYDPLGDFEPICRLVMVGLFIAVHPALPVSNLSELVAYARTRPSGVSCATAGVGTINHLVVETLRLQAGLPDLRHVPYFGAGPATADLVAGEVQLLVAVATAQLIDLHRAGKIRILAVTTPARLHAARDIPTTIESRMPELNAQSWFGLFAPKATPRAIIDHIARATSEGMGDPSFLQTLLAAGMEPDLHSSPEKMLRTLKGDIARWTPVISAIGPNIDQNRAPQRVEHEILDRFANGVILVDRQGKVLFANAAARMLAKSRSPFRISGAEIKTNSPPLTAQLGRLIQKAAAGAASNHLLLPLSGDGRSLHIRISSVRGKDICAFSSPHTDSVVAILHISDPRIGASVPVKSLIDAYGLTEAEARVAIAVTQGLPMTRTARDIGLSPNTIKTHMRHIFVKTGTSGQVQLAMLLTALAMNHFCLSSAAADLKNRSVSHHIG
jgi:tripartite-type tricarboxylate transporter receptor subunit TctC/DNA-binding CsgD family transcriptional regulator